MAVERQRTRVPRYKPTAPTLDALPLTGAVRAWSERALADLKAVDAGEIPPQSIEVSDVIARDTQNLPVVSRRTAHSTIQIQNGGTAAVAGLVDTRSQSGDSGVPGFADVPLLGRAFRTETLNHQTRQVAVFVTATVVADDDTTFKTGKPRRPAPIIVDANVYRQQLSAALRKLEATQQNEGSVVLAIAVRSVGGDRCFSFGWMHRSHSGG